MNLVTPQTGPEGQKVRAVLVAGAVDIAKEYYLALRWTASGART